MSPNPLILRAACAALALLVLGAGPARAQAEHAPAKPGPQCFYLTQWRGGWRSPSKDVIYLRVEVNDVWRLDLNGGSTELLMPNTHLVNIARGGDSVCAPIDLDLFVSDDHGFRIPLFVRAITKLTPEEVAALPAKFRP